jgi:hypothetical protein
VSRQAGLTRATLVALLAAVGLAAAAVATWRARSAPHTARGAGPASGAATAGAPPANDPAAAGDAADAGADDAADADAVELDKEVDGEPVIQEGRFAGWPRSQWRDYYGERLGTMREDLEAARAIVARAQAGEAVDAAELAQARTRVRDLELRIRFDENDLREVERAK